MMICHALLVYNLFVLYLYDMHEGYKTMSKLALKYGGAYLFKIVFIIVLLRFFWYV